jgi:pimeloyl-ACP methyl ester carboxylesterase
MRAAAVADAPVHAIRYGAGQRRALFIHCTLAHSGAWTRVQAELLDTLDMTAFDRPGHGRSADWSGEGGPVGLLDFTTWMAAEIAGKPTDIVGHSYGGLVALRLALTRPDLVRSLTLIEPPLFAAIRGTPAFDAHAEAMRGFAAALADGDRVRAAEIFHRATSPDAPWERLPGPARTGLARRIHAIGVENPVTMDDAAGLLTPGGLENIAAPVLLLQGSVSPPILAETLHALAARLPGARRVLIAGAGHMAPITHPVNVAAELALFLKL